MMISPNSTSNSYSKNLKDQQVHFKGEKRNAKTREGFQITQKENVNFTSKIMTPEDGKVMTLASEDTGKTLQKRRGVSTPAHNNSQCSDMSSFKQSSYFQSRINSKAGSEIEQGRYVREFSYKSNDDLYLQTGDPTLISPSENENHFEDQFMGFQIENDYVGFLEVPKGEVPQDLTISKQVKQNYLQGMKISESLKEPLSINKKVNGQQNHIIDFNEMNFMNDLEQDQEDEEISTNMNFQEGSQNILFEQPTQFKKIKNVHSICSPTSTPFLNNNEQVDKDERGSYQQKGVMSRDLNTEQYEHQQYDDDMPTFRTQNIIQSQKKTKLKILTELKTIKEQPSINQAEEKSQIGSPSTESSILEQRKVVSDYLFSDREPFFENDYTKCYVACKNQRLVQIKLLERKKIKQSTQELIRKEYSKLKMSSELINDRTKEKILDDEEPGSPSNQASLKTEGFLSRKRSVVNLIDFFFTKNYIYFVSEYLHKQNLLFLLTNLPKARMSEQKALVILKKIAEAVDEIVLTLLPANQKSLNCNLKLQNIFWDGEIVKLSDFSYSYILSKKDIFNHKQNYYPNLKSSVNNFSDVKSIGIIFLQMICGIESIDQTQDFTQLQKYLHAQGILRQTSEFLLKCIFIESTTIGDVRTYVQKCAHRNKKIDRVGSSTPSVNFTINDQLEANNYNNNNNNYQKLNMNFSQPAPFMKQTSNHLDKLQNQLKRNDKKKNTFKKLNSFADIQISTFLDKLDDEKQSNLSDMEDNSFQEQSKVKNFIFLKNYSYKQGPQFYELKITHLKIMKYFFNEELLTNNTEFTTTHTIPVFTHSSDSLKKKVHLQSLNYNPKYQWVILNEIDNLSYFDIKSYKEDSFDEKTKYLSEGYKRIQRQRLHLMRCRDNVSRKNYVIKCIIIEDDQEFLDILREIAIHKYIDHNLHKGIQISQGKVTLNKFCLHYLRLQFEFKTKNDEGKNDEDKNETDLKESAQKATLSYLQQLYKQADKEVQKQFKGGIHKFIDSYIVQRIGSEITFILVLEDIEFTLKDYINKNSIVQASQLNRQKSDINQQEQQQVLQMVNILAKQIKKLKKIGIYHNNITPENIMFQTTKSGGKRILLSNFENAFIKNNDQVAMSEFSSAFLKMPQSFYKYKPPEIRKITDAGSQEKEIDNFDPIKSDVFSLGLCSLELVVQHIITNQSISKSIDSINQDTVVGGLIMAMVHYSTSYRFSEEEILSYVKAERSFDESYKINNFSQLFMDKEQEKYQSEKSKQEQKKLKRSSTFNLPQLNQLQEKIRIRNQLLERKMKEGIKLYQDENLFQYEEKNLYEIDEITGDMQQLYLSKCARKLFLFPYSLQILDSLKQKYLNQKQKVPQQYLFEIFMLEEWGNFRKDLLDHKGALSYYQKSFYLQQKYYQEEHHTAAKLQFKIGLLQLQEDPKNNNQALSMLRTALESYKEVYKNSTPKFIPILISIGDELALKGQVIDSLHIYQECLIITNSIGFSGPIGIKLVDKLGWAFFETSDYQSAQKFFMKSVSLKEKVFYQQGISLAETYNNLAECLRILNESQKAIHYYESSLDIIESQREELVEANQKLLQDKKKQFERELGELLQLKAQVYNNLGLIFKQQEKFEQAVQLFEESLKIRTEYFGPTSPESNECNYNLAVISAEQNKHTEAMALYDIMIQQYKLTKDIDNLIYAECLQNKGISCYHINDFAKALSLFNESLAIKKKKNPSSLSIAISIQNLALVYHKQGQYKKSLSLYYDSLKIFVKKLKPDHPFIITIQDNIKQTQRFAK